MKKEKLFKDKVRELIANYIYTEGCSCCRHEDHAKYEEQLAILLNVPKYADGSGYDFDRFNSICRKKHDEH